MSGAFISGRDGVAVVEDGDELVCIQRGSLSAEPVSHGLLPYLFEATSAATYHPDVDVRCADQLLDNACRRERALQLTLISLDPDSSKATRELADDALEEFLRDTDVSNFLQNRLFSKPLPACATWHREAAAPQSHPNLIFLKHSLLHAQDGIRRARRAWDMLPDDLFPMADERAQFDSTLIGTGAFRMLAVSVLRGSHSERDAQVRILGDASYSGFANYRHILGEWTTGIADCRARVAGEDGHSQGQRHRGLKPGLGTQKPLIGVNAVKDLIVDSASALFRFAFFGDRVKYIGHLSR